MKPDRKKGQAKNPREAQAGTRARTDDPEPSVGTAGLPITFFIVLSAVLYWGMVYLDNHAGGFNPLVYQRFASSNELVKLVPYDPAKEQVMKGLAVYNRPTCAACHQPNGQGTPGLFPPLAGAEWVLESDPGRIIRIVLDGMSGPVTVKGQTYNNVMPPWRPTLNDEEIAQVLTYIRQTWGNNAASVTTEQVAEVRKATEGRTTTWTAEELLQIPAAP